MKSNRIFKISHYLFLIIFASTIHHTKAQIPVEILAGNNRLQHEFFFFKDLDNKHKFNLFSMARFAVDYEDETLNSSFMSSQITYNLSKSWGISGGGLYAENNFNPLLAVSYTYFNKKGDLFINIFPTAIFNEEVEFEMFGLFFYTPKISKKFNLFSQLIFGTTVNNHFEEHIFSYQQIRLGLDYKKLFQFGLGIDQNFFGTDLEYNNNIGFFIRKEL